MHILILFSRPSLCLSGLSISLSTIPCNRCILLRLLRKMIPRRKFSGNIFLITEAETCSLRICIVDRYYVQTRGEDNWIYLAILFNVTHKMHLEAMRVLLRIYLCFEIMLFQSILLRLGLDICILYMKLKDSWKSLCDLERL